MTWYAIEGMDGSGKSSVASVIENYLKKRKRRVLVITHPNPDNKWGNLASKYLHGKSSKFTKMKATVFYIMDVLNSLKFKRNHCKEYDDVIFVRYSMAAAYLPKSLIKIGYKIIEFVLPVPDMKILVDIQPDVALERIKSRGESLEIFETKEELTKTRNRMMLISKSWIVVDNSGNFEETEKEVMKIILTHPE